MADSENDEEAREFGHETEELKAPQEHFHRRLESDRSHQQSSSNFTPTLCKYILQATQHY